MRDAATGPPAVLSGISRLPGRPVPVSVQRLGALLALMRVVLYLHHLLFVEHMSPADPAFAVQVLGTIGEAATMVAVLYRPRLAPFFLIPTLGILLIDPLAGRFMLALLISFALAAYTTPARPFALMLGSFLVWQVVYVLFVSDLEWTQLWNFVPLTLLLIAPGVTLQQLAVRTDTYRHRATEAELALEEAARQERQRLARELHDLVSHELTIIAMHTRVAEGSGEPEVMRRTLHTVGDASRSALVEMRRLLTIMRTDQPDPDGTPDAGYAQGPGPEILLRDAEATLAAAGVDVKVTIRTSRHPLPSVVRSTLQQVLREAVTNVIRHGGDNCACSISLTDEGEAMVLRVRNSVGPEPVLPPSGYGLIGMRERIDMLGGHLEAGPQDGVWQLQAHLPTVGAGQVAAPETDT